MIYGGMPVYVHIGKKFPSFLKEDALSLKTTETYNLEVFIDTFSIEVTAEVEFGCPDYVIYSVMLAALKNVEDHYYHVAKNKLSSETSIEIDDGVSSKVARQIPCDSKSKFKYEIIEVISVSGITKPNLMIQHSAIYDCYSMTFSFSVRGKQIGVMESVSGYLYAYDMNGQAKWMQSAMIQAMESQYPEYASQICFVKRDVCDFKMLPDESLQKSLPSKEDRRVRELPGVNEMVKNPVTGDKMTLMRVIIYLNDNERWTREQIADWLDTLDIDLRFKSE